MILCMPRSVHITAPRSSYEEQVKQLRIPKVRQEQLREIVAETRRRLAAGSAGAFSDSMETGERAESAAAAR